MLKGSFTVLFSVVMAVFIVASCGNAADIGATVPMQIAPAQGTVKPLLSAIPFVTLNYDNKFSSSLQGVRIDATFAKVNTWPADKAIGLPQEGYIHLFSSYPLPGSKYNVSVQVTNCYAGTFSFYYPSVTWSAFAAPGKLITSCQTPLVDPQKSGGCGVDIPLISNKLDIVIKHTAAPWITGIIIKPAQ